MALLWGLIAGYIIGAVIYELGGMMALMIAIFVVIIWAFITHYPSWMPNRLFGRHR